MKTRLFLIGLVVGIALTLAFTHRYEFQCVTASGLPVNTKIDHWTGSSHTEIAYPDNYYPPGSFKAAAPEQQFVDVKGHGTVSFPAGTSKEEMEKSLRKQFSFEEARGPAPTNAP